MDSKTVFELRNEAKSLHGISKLDKLSEAHQLAQRLFSVEPFDEWIQKALAYTLIDLCKYYLALNHIDLAVVHFKQLLSIDFEEDDEIIESQKNFLRPKIDPSYAQVQKANDFSKNGNHQEAILLFKKIISEKHYNNIHDEAYGWIIYRYVSNKDIEMTSVEVRTFLRDYLKLKNDRPSLLHSMILNFALKYSKVNQDLNLHNFFKLWHPANLRREDKEKQLFEGNQIPSLLSRIIREFVDKDVAVDFDFLLKNTDLATWGDGTSSDQKVLDLFREPYFWRLVNTHKENKLEELWKLFEQYNRTFSNFEKSKWHSEILSIAERYMQEEEAWRFLEFFRTWNPEQLRSDDWQEVIYEGHAIKPLAIRTIRKAYEIIKAQSREYDATWLLPTYAKAVELFPENEWLLREHALLLIRNNELGKATEIYKKLVLDLGDKVYIWKEFSYCVAGNCDLQIGMLSKAIQLEGNEDFLGDIRLELAKALYSNGFIENCCIELKFYKSHRELMGWKLSDQYVELADKTKDQHTEQMDNKRFYATYSPIAEKFAYADIPWTDVTIVDKWNNEEGKERIALTDGKMIDFTIGAKRFAALKQSSIGQVWQVKLHKNEIKNEVFDKFQRNKVAVRKYKYNPLLLEKSDKPDWASLADIYAYVDFINTEKKIVHVLSSDNVEVFFPFEVIPFQIGDFIIAKSFKKKVKEESRLELRQIKRIDKGIAIMHFAKMTAIISGVNNEKELFYFVGAGEVQGSIRFAESTILPVEGKFLEIYYVTKRDRKHNRFFYKAINHHETEETDPSLIKSINGLLKLKYKRGDRTIDYLDLDKNEISNAFPDFGFVGEVYVPKNVLSEKKITENCNVAATAIFLGDKWKIIKLTLQ